MITSASNHADHIRIRTDAPATKVVRYAYRIKEGKDMVLPHANGMDYIFAFDTEASREDFTTKYLGKPVPEDWLPVTITHKVETKVTRQRKKRAAK